MPKPRTPTNILHLKGAFQKDPQRLKARENEPENKNPIGEPSDRLNELEKEAYREIVRIAIDGVLGEADRLAVERAAVLLVRQHGLSDIKPTSSDEGHLRAYFGQLGMLPGDRSKISITKPKPKNKFDD